MRLTVTRSTPESKLACTEDMSASRSNLHTHSYRPESFSMSHLSATITNAFPFFADIVMHSGWNPLPIWATSE
ncbi:hypothetical protein RSOL_496240 [Rhizoctonia solani AG-3 Rhs1AP]|uniref:Uncharacterized protein n=1 Tax=Rhizoctonia solani AG-3 Rhs1AP TaxID=1086054 RepID=X8JMN6_9AGAM|nr:hypothetical protein RSOL_496240 [Rhizoctonia solani AG-3 Rhs1AP]